MIRIKGSVAEALQRVLIDKILKIFIIPCFDLLDLVGSTESVEEVDERNAALKSCEVSYRRKVHNFLHGGAAQHGAAGLTTCIHIGVIAENAECMAGHCTCGYVEDARKLFTGDFVKVRDHQKKTLGCGKCGGHSTGCQRAVERACRTCFRLHLCDLYFLTEDILAAGGSPFIHMLRHNGRRSNRIDGRHFGKCIRCMSRSFVAIHGQHFSFCHVSCILLICV